MLIYNFKKEFLGIDEQDLEALGYNNLAELRAESEDFADLFIKTPGYVHNFKHVHWIDFISCAEGAEESKVIIFAKEQGYKATLIIKSIYLVDAPAQKAYAINLQNLRALTREEASSISDDLATRVIPQGASSDAMAINANIEEPLEIVPETLTKTQDPYESDNTNSKIIKDIYEEEAPIEISFDDEEEDNFVEKEITPTEVKTPQIQKVEQQETPKKEIIVEDDDALEIMLDDDEDEIELVFEEEVKPKPTPKVQKIQEEVKQEIPSIEVEEDEYEYIEVEVEEDENDELLNYQFDPTVASDELGLPLDLIEEFIEDFIAQAKEFKPELYSALDVGDFEKIKKLSHMLKGVAANLRIENARDILITINTSNNIDEIKTNLDRFYKIVAKLAGEEIPKKVIRKKVKKEPKVVAVENNTKVEEQIDELVDLELPDDDLLVMDDVIEKSESKVVEVDNSAISIDIEDDDELLVIEDELDLIVEEDIKSVVEDKKEDMISIEIEEDDEPLLLLDDEISISDEPKVEDEVAISYDKEKIAEDIGLDVDSFNELFDDYIKDAISLSEVIENNIKENNVSEWKKNAITLKGMSENMRVEYLDEELDTISNTDDINIASKAISKIKNIIPKIGA